MCLPNFMKFHHCLIKILKNKTSQTDGQMDGQTDVRSNILGLWATSMLNSHREVAPKM